MKKEFLIIFTFLFLISVSFASASLSDFWSSLFNEPTAPQIVSAHADPLKVRPGQILNIYVQFDDMSKVTDARAFFYHEDGFDEVPMTMIASDQHGLFTYKASWEVHSTLDQVWYETIYSITNEHGETLNGKVMWQDPTVSHTPDEILPGTFNAGEYVFPSTTNISTLVLENSLSSADCAKITGSSALCDGTDSIGTIDCKCTDTATSGAGTGPRNATATLTGSGYNVTGGGCRDAFIEREVVESTPASNGGWFCKTSDDNGVLASGQATATVCGCRIT